MATFVLVHGAWHGSWCWTRVRKALQAQGHDVFTPTLTSVGERSHLLSRDVNLDTHIADVENLMRWEDLSGVVLCGHSYGGCVISGVADRVPERIQALVYLDAFILENGESLHDTLPAAQRDVLEACKPLETAGKCRRFQPRSSTSTRPIANGSTASARCTVATFEQAIQFSGGAHRQGCTRYIRARNGFVDSPFPPFYEKAKARGWNTITVPCGHDVMLDLPDDLTRILVDASKEQPLAV